MKDLKYDPNDALIILHTYALKYARLRGNAELFDLLHDCVLILIDSIKETKEGN